MRTATTILAIVLGGAGAAAQSRPATPTNSVPGVPVSASSSAYYEFLLGRHLDANGDLEGSLAAFQRAATLDPGSAEIQADLAGLYVRQNRTKDAIAAGEQALKNDPTSITANRVLGRIYALLAERARPGAAGTRENAERAIRYLEKSDPAHDVNVQLLLGQLYVRTQAWDQAIAVLSKLVDQEPGFSEAVMFLVQAYEGAGRNEEAIKLLEDNGGSTTQLMIMLGELYEGEERWADAAEAYGRASQRQPRNVDLKVRWATALLSVGETPAVDKARTVLKEVAAGNPSQVRALYLLVQAERSLSNPVGAEATARRLIDANPNGVWGQYALAQLLADKRDYRGVIQTLEPVIAGWTTRSDNGQGLSVGRLYEQLGQAYQGLKRYDKAIEQFERAREVAPGDIRLARLEARALRESGQLERGIGLLEEVLKRTGQQAGAYAALAELYVDAGRIPQALGVLDRAAAQLPNDTAVAFQLGAALERQKHFAEAERVFRQVITRDPGHAQALNYLGYMLADRGERLQESVGYIKRALELEPDNPAYLDSLGWAYFKLDRLDLAELHLRKAAADLASNSVIQDHLGDTLFKLGNFDEAATAWERALSGDGDSIERSTIERKMKTARDKRKQK